MTMRLHLIDEMRDISIDIAFTDIAQEAWAVQWQRCDTIEAKESLQQRLLRQLDAAISEGLDWDLKPPTAAQIAYAMDIARSVGVSLPAEALRYRGATHEFIERNESSFKKRGGAKF